MSESASQPMVELLSTAKLLRAVSPSASTVKPVHVTVAAVKSPVASRLVKVPAAAEAAPIVVPSIAPASMSTESKYATPSSQRSLNSRA